MISSMMKYVGIVLSVIISLIILSWFLKKEVRFDTTQLELSFRILNLNVSKRLIDYLAPASFIILPILGFVRRRREMVIEKQLPDAIMLISNALKSGIAISSTIEIVASQLSGPIAEEFYIMNERIKDGSTVETALYEMYERVRSEDVRIFIQSIEVLRRSGGNLIEVLDILKDTITQRARVTDKIGNLTAMGRYQCIMLIIVPWALASMLHLASPGFLKPLYETRIGIFFLVIGILLELFGAIWLKKIITVKI